MAAHQTRFAPSHNSIQQLLEIQRKHTEPTTKMLTTFSSFSLPTRSAAAIVVIAALLLSCFGKAWTRFAFLTAFIAVVFSSQIFNLIPPSLLFKMKQSWSSFLTVDPIKIASALLHRGRLLIPEHMWQDIEVLAQVCSVQESKFKIVDRRLEFVNFTISHNGSEDLRIGRVQVEWDSYLKPTFTLEVKQVEVLVEFTNLQLTTNNWNELREMGFPPNMLLSSSEDTVDDNASTTTTTATSSFVRVDSIKFEGDMVVHVESRLVENKELFPDLVLSLEQLQGLSNKVSRVSKANQQQEGRLGCTTTQLYEITTNWFQKKIISTVKKAATDLAAPGSGARMQEHAKRAMSSATPIFKEYVKEASNKVLKEEFVDKPFDKLNGLMPEDQVEKMRRLSHAGVDAITDGTIFKEIQRGFEKARKARQG